MAIHKLAPVPKSRSPHATTVNMNFDFDVSRSVIDVLSLAGFHCDQQENEVDGTYSVQTLRSKERDFWFTQHHPLHEIQNKVVENVTKEMQLQEKTSVKSRMKPFTNANTKGPLWPVKVNASATATAATAGNLACMQTTGAARVKTSTKTSVLDPFYTAGMKGITAAAASITTSRKRTAEAAQLTSEDSVALACVTDSGSSASSRTATRKAARIAPTLAPAPAPVLTVTVPKLKPSQVKVHIEPTRKPVVSSKIYTGKSKNVATGAGKNKNISSAASTAAAAAAEHESKALWAVKQAQELESEYIELLNKHKKKYASSADASISTSSNISAYVPSTHSVRDTRRWEKEAGKLWLELSATEREVASLEIARMRGGGERERSNA